MLKDTIELHAKTVNENIKLKKRVKELEDFLRWCIAEGATTKDILLALEPKMSCKEYKRIIFDNY